MKARERKAQNSYALSVVAVAILMMGIRGHSQLQSLVAQQQPFIEDEWERQDIYCQANTDCSEWTLCCSKNKCVHSNICIQGLKYFNDSCDLNFECMTSCCHESKCSHFKHCHYHCTTNNDCETTTKCCSEGFCWDHSICSAGIKLEGDYCDLDSECKNRLECIGNVCAVNPIELHPRDVILIIIIIVIGIVALFIIIYSCFKICCNKSTGGKVDGGKRRHGSPNEGNRGNLPLLGSGSPGVHSSGSSLRSKTSSKKFNFRRLVKG